jgi:hypothetical protein
VVHDSERSRAETLAEAAAAVDAHNRRVKKYRKDHDNDTPTWAAEAFGLLDKDEDDDEGENATPLGKGARMADWSTEALQGTLDELEAKMSGRDLKKAMTDIADDVEGLTTRQGRHEEAMASLRAKNARLEAEVKDLRRQHAATRQAQRASTDEVKAMRKERDKAHQEPEEEPSDLVKSVASFLPDHATRQQAEQVALWVVKSFGRHGGQALPYNRELASKLVLTKSISAEEHQNWKTYGRLPDGVALGKSTGRAESSPNAAVLAAHYLASAGISPMVAPSLVRRR